MKVIRLSGIHVALLLIAGLGGQLVSAGAAAQSAARSALEINIGFNGPADQFPYSDEFYKATDAYYHSFRIGSMPGDRHCHAYLSWDLAQQTPGSGPIDTEGSRAWFESWLAQAQGHCDQALITFKYVSGVTQSSGYPDTAVYEGAIVAFLDTDWSYTGWRGRFDYTAWNEPNNGAGSGAGLTTPIAPDQAADYYLVLRKHCRPPHCIVAAGDFGSNGTLWVDFVQNCPSDIEPVLCSNASYIDEYKHFLALDAEKYGFSRDFRPELFSYHGWDDINNYINSGSQCTDPERCTIRAIVHSLSKGRWAWSMIWDTEVGAGQDPQSNPDPITQACAAAFLLRLTADTSWRVQRIYYTRPYMSDGQYWSLFDGDGTAKPAFTVLVDRETRYSPPSGSSCP